MIDSFGDRLKKLRENDNITIEKLSNVIGCSMRTIQRYENEHTPPDTYNLIKIATFFNTTTDYLLGLSSKKLELELTDKRSFFIEYLSSKLQDIDTSEVYYWIFSYINEDGEEIIGGETQFKQFLDNTYQQEIRELRGIYPDKAFEVCENVKGTPIIINNEKDIRVFLMFGGEAFIKKSLCEKYLPHYLHPYIVYCNSYLL